MPENFVVIMAGGRGERFWPQSRLRRPKHLLPIVGDTPMLAQTCDRLAGSVKTENILIITNAAQLEAVREVCPQLPTGNIVGEPVGRDTAAAVGLAMELVRARDPEGVFAMLPADAAIHDAVGFRRGLDAALAAAAAGPVIVTIGVEPTFPATGYGYIRKGEPWQAFDGLQGYRVERFVEKPDEATAQDYLASGQYFWNAGMFLFSVPTIAECFEKYTPTLNEALGRIGSQLAAGAAIDAVLADCYPALEKISVDYAIMEPASADGKIVTLPACFDWDDVGEWPAIARHCEQDAAGNVLRGNGIVESGQGNILVGGDGHTIALLGVDDLIVVHTPDATLVCAKDRAQDIKKLVKQLAADEQTQGLV